MDQVFRILQSALQITVLLNGLNNNATTIRHANGFTIGVAITKTGDFALANMTLKTTKGVVDVQE